MRSTTVCAGRPRMTGLADKAELPQKRGSMPDNIIQPTIPTTPVTPAILESLRAIVGDKGLIADDQGKEPFVTDWRRSRVGTASVVVRPATVEETSKVVKLCYEHGIAIVPQAGNTGLMGGATPWPTHQGIVLSVGRMNKVLSVDPVGYSMTVEIGLHPADPAGDRGSARPLLPAQPRRPGLVPDRRQSLDQCRWRAGAALRQRAQPRDGPRGRAAQRRHLERPALAQEGQHRLRPQAPVHGRRGHARHHHQGGAEAVAGVQGRRHRLACRARPASGDRDPVRGAFGVRGQCRIVRDDEPRGDRNGAAPHSGRAGSAQGRHAVVPADAVVVIATQGRRRRGHVGEDGAVPRRADGSRPGARRGDQPEREPGAQHVEDPRGCRRSRPRRGTGAQLRHLRVDLEDSRVHRQGHRGGARHPADPAAASAGPYRRRQRALRLRRAEGHGPRDACSNTRRR